MKFACRTALLSCLLVSVALLGAEDLSPPDPAKLAADWWSYFVVDPKTGPDTVDTRIENARRFLGESRDKLVDGEQSKLGPLYDSIIERLAVYGKLRNAKLPISPPATVPAQTYSVTKIFELGDTLRKVRIELGVEAQEVSRLEKALKAGETEQSRRKVTYLESSDTAPDRIEQGLLLMQSRVQLEIASEQLKRRRAQQKILEIQIDALRVELDTAFDRLNVDPDRISFWEEQQRQAIARLNELNGQLTRTQIDQSSILATTPIEKAQTQLTSQKITLLEVQAAIQQVQLAKAEWAIAGIQRVLSGNETDTKADRDLLKTHSRRLEEIQDRLKDWNRTIAQSRNTATEQLAEEKDNGLVTMYESRVVMADQAEQELRRLEDALDTTMRLSDLIDHLLSKREGRLGQGVQLAEDAVQLTWETLRKLMTASLFEVGETPVTTLGIFRFLIIIIVAWWVSKLLRGGLQRVAQRRHTVSEASVYTLGRVVHYFILTIAVVIGLSSIGVDLTKFALIASALGIGIGFGLQNLVSNFVSGLIILFERSLKAGDFVELESGVSGEVREINMRATLINTNDNVDILVPNSEFVNGRVTNWTMREAQRRVHIPFGVAYGTNKDLVKQAALEAAEAVPWTLKGGMHRAPQVWFVEFGDSSLNFELVVWLIPEAVKRPGSVQAAYLWEIESKLASHNIEIPFPQRDLHLRSAFGKKDEDVLNLMQMRAET
jgi:small-conductance mechanosensitive channel